MSKNINGYENLKLSSFRTFLAIIISFILVCTIISVVRKSAPDTLVTKISIITTVEKLFLFNESSMRTAGVDLLRVIFVIAGSVSHNLVCIEVPLGLFVTSKFENWSSSDMTNVNLQISILCSNGFFQTIELNFSSMKRVCPG